MVGTIILSSISDAEIYHDHVNLWTAADRHGKYTEILLSKGILQRHPSIVRLQKAEIVHDENSRRSGRQYLYLPT